ncbi:hypothetical protein [Actinacidiphila rubida]|nr:hypothetical protein [Actinacidiphila rubida]
MMIDSRLKSVYDDQTQPDPKQQELIDQYAASLGPGDLDDMLDGACTIIYMFMQWLRMAYEDHGKDALECVVPNLVATMRMMPKSVPPEAIPTMAGLLVAAGTGLSPGLWRKQFGQWSRDEMNPLEAVCFLLAEHINRLTDDRDFAARLIAEALSGIEGG